MVCYSRREISNRCWCRCWDHKLGVNTGILFGDYGSGGHEVFIHGGLYYFCFFGVGWDADEMLVWLLLVFLMEASDVGLCFLLFFVFSVFVAMVFFSF